MQVGRRLRTFFTGLAVALAAAVGSTMMTASASTAASTFPDVPTTSPFYHAISWLADQQITTGFADGTFRPRNQITREAMAAFLYRLSGSPDYTPPSAPTLSDVPVGSAFYKEINWLSANGITTGYPDGTFRPRNHITREAMAAFLHRYATMTGTSDDDVANEDLFLDVTPGSIFSADIAWLATSGISTGYEAGSGCYTYRPRNAVTREAMAAFLYRFETGNDTGSAPTGKCSPAPRGSGSLSGNAGTVRVGSAIKPGTYQSTRPKSSILCYWERLSSADGEFDSILANDAVIDSKSIVTILPGDAYFHTDGCGTWTPIPKLGALSSKTTISGTAGTLLVGPDIRPGTYTSTNPDSCYWARLSNFTGVFDAIIANDISTTVGASMVVTVLNSDHGFVTEGCGTWKLAD
ncbi:S-layer homology domain-containing protein [Microbacterium protaetiae]|uniref:S-layer homology domain-containing protein n=1 Tax=Microbacterium protaetiae TaxID=2509458 RepID=A0A4P6EHF6_9MICO|nr:S-layer homology domain-containing protein [Microbacterium protaetiae]QAY60629.1 S-layer homology domain-containing protein [Microbacterium protaetiae]